MSRHTRQFLTLLLCALLLPAVALAGGQARRIAVAADGEDAQAQVSLRTARAPYILIFDGRGQLLEAHPNPITRSRGAGPALGQWLADNQVDALIGGDIGPRLAGALESLKIEWFEKSGPVDRAVEAVLK